MRKHRGQSAMEYIMTYSWAILVVMIVGIVMWQLGIFNIGASTLSFRGFGAIKPQLAGTGMDAAGTFDGIFMNGVGTDIIINEVIVNDTATAGGCIGTCTGNLPIPCPGTVVGQGENFRVTATGCGGGLIGSTYDLYVSIGYNVTVGDAPPVTRKSSGFIRGPYE